MTPRGRRARARRRRAEDFLRREGLRHVAFFALPAALPVWGLALYIGLQPGASEHTSWWTPVVFLPLAALAGVVGAITLRRALVVGSAIALTLGALTALANPVIALFYLLPAGLMGLTARRVPRT